MRTHDEFGAGDMVQFADGSLQGCNVRVVSIEGAQARLMVKLFGRDHEFLVRSDKMIKAHS